MNLNGIRRLRSSHRVLFPVLVVVLALMLISSTVLAAMIITHQGSVEVVTSGGGGGGGGGGGTPIYTFAIYDSATGGSPLLDNDLVFDFGTINVNSYTEKTIYVQKTGAGDVTVTPAVNGLDTGTGVITFTPASVTVTDASTRLPIVVRFTSGSAAAAVDAFSVIYTGSP